MRTTSTLDAAGLNLITSNNVVASLYSNTKNDSFGSPPADYTGYGYDGVKRNVGVADETDLASWSTEASSANRGEENPFPNRVFIIANGSSVVVLNADDLKVWMRFNYSDTVTKISFDDGYLCVMFSGVLAVYSFIEDKFWEFSTTYARQYSSIVNRNSPSSPTTGSQRLKGVNRDVSIRRVLGNWHVCLSHQTGITALTISGFNISSSSLNHNLFEKAIILNQTNSVTISALEIIQSPPYSPDNATDYSADGLRGDKIKVTSPVSTGYDVFITKTLSDRFIFSGTIDAGLIGSHSTVNMTILKPGHLCLINADGSLFFSAGQAFFRSISAWLTGSVDVFTEDKSVSPVSLDLSNPFYGAVLSGESFIAASSEGIMFLDKSTVDSVQPCELRYSDNTSATYSSIFSSSTRPSTSVAVDPQNGNVLIGAGTSIIEVQPQGDLHKLIRTIEAGGTVRHILAFSNPENSLGV
jgi:hypothetical protein